MSDSEEEVLKNESSSEDASEEEEVQNQDDAMEESDEEVIPTRKTRASRTVCYSQFIKIILTWVMTLRLFTKFQN